MSEWKKVKLGEFIDVLSGYAFKSKDFSDHGIPVIKIKNVCPPYISLDDLSYVPESIAFQNQRYILHKGDVLIAMTGSHINQIASVVGRVGRVRYDDISVLNQRVGKIINKDDRQSNLDYIYYFLSQYEVKVELAQKAGGAANQANISPSDIKDLLLPYPPIDGQLRIATILSRYDSLIENYQKQIKLLEEAAQRLYKEWFVDLRFPGHENTKIVDGVPEGWEKKMVGDLLCMHMNGGWGKDSSTGLNVIQAPVIRGTDIDKIKGGFFDDLPIRFHTEKDIYNKHLEVNDIILELSNGNINNVGRTLRIDDNLLKQYGKHVICASFCKFLRPIDYRISIILFSEFQDMQNGSRMQKFKKNGANGINNFDFQEFLKHVVIVPPVSFTIKELEIIQKSISDYRVQIRLLTEARDRLLSKLMNSEISAIGEMA